MQHKTKSATLLGGVYNDVPFFGSRRCALLSIGRGVTQGIQHNRREKGSRESRARRGSCFWRTRPRIFKLLPARTWSGGEVL